MAHYAKPEYWEERYKRDLEPFEWYQRWSGIRDIVTQYVKTSDSILNLGCGNSKMNEDMHDEGFWTITNIDNSQTLIRAMDEHYTERGFKYLLMDALNLEFEDGNFEAIIDKGTFDSILCGDTSNSTQVLGEIHRVLSPTGVFICVSYASPEYRMKHFEKFDWQITVHQVPKPLISATAVLTSEDPDFPNMHFIYACKKSVESS